MHGRKASQMTFFYDQLIFFMGNENMSVWHFLDHDDDNNNKHSMRAKSVILWRKENILILICQLMLIIMKNEKSLDFC